MSGKLKDDQKYILTDPASRRLSMEDFRELEDGRRFGDNDICSKCDLGERESLDCQGTLTKRRNVLPRRRQQPILGRRI